MGRNEDSSSLPTSPLTGFLSWKVATPGTSTARGRLDDTTLLCILCIAQCYPCSTVGCTGRTTPELNGLCRHCSHQGPAHLRAYPPRHVLCNKDGMLDQCQHPCFRVLAALSHYASEVNRWVARCLLGQSKSRVINKYSCSIHERPCSVKTHLEGARR